MALLRMKEIREMTAEGREKKLKEIRDELLHERGVAAMGGAPHSPGQIRALRKNLARIVTVMAEERGKATASTRKEEGKGGSAA
ncbi:MAG TPA: 50S ribosomal protein L29 [Thermoplasmata archaeon]|uniref:Large ribosomal subunit protein uL29 n=1 Tax=uncultured euryarchaeote Rifle_16ft_4_minimus_37789 TaxID=1665195 RepID=A0A0H4T8U7_9EURY|nr:50S ribosomal protein L29P [uncultured euryarchaeote Rifle_16ft_4_minimus_37789]HKZ63686.1 50S ribosomal protein L29 [Thermoplasmata archaeon]